MKKFLLKNFGQLNFAFNNTSFSAFELTSIHFFCQISSLTGVNDQKTRLYNIRQCEYTFTLFIVQNKNRTRCEPLPSLIHHRITARMFAEDYWITLFPSGTLTFN